MIRKNEETGSEPKKISSFKRFSDLSTKKEPSEGSASPILPETDDDRPANPNLPYNKEKMEKPMSTKYMMPNPDSETIDEEEKNEKKDNVKFYGKVAKLPKGIKASKGYNFLENIKVSKSSIWYLLVEKQGNELQMVKYNHKKGVDMSRFVGDLKTYYISKYKGNQEVCKMIESIEIEGNDKYSCIKNIPLVEVDGKKMISKITEDLIKLLSK
jgi:hypothetical protein